ncbi:MAG: DNA mismatch repair endonuclease MutL [Clostridiales bacterium]|nr:DNA mismatch repair endonuclease MutL [Clostridiales bacterium]
MAKINILTKEIYNRISAGEVVERPYSAVKELVENSLDAGATEISIYIEKGGKQLIKVIDNGCGIEKDDLRSAFVPHATSKISTVEDLDKITTLGFRGEALASIASISKTEIISVTEGNEANKIVCDGGKIGKIETAALEKGTEITVYDLFYNTPVRAKFLKADKSEENDITNFVTRFILGNPYVSFKYYADGKLILQSHGGGPDEAIAQVYGAKVIPQCFKIRADRHGICLYGYIGNTNFFKPNKTYQSLFLNGRYIVNNTVATAINNAYSSYAMKRQYPFYVLFLDLPLEMVDVNVHPNKADVRFVDSKLIFGTVYNVVSSVLDGNIKAADYVIKSEVLPEIKSTMPSDGQNKNAVYAEEKAIPSVKDSFKHKEEEQIIDENGNIFIKIDDEFSRLATQGDNYFPSISTSDNLSKESYLLQKQMEQVRPDPDFKLDKSKLNAQLDLSLTEFFGEVTPNVLSVSTGYKGFGYEEEKEVKEPPKQQELCTKNFVFKGAIFNTYLIYEINDEIYLIDQHAAHERLIYDKIKKDIENRKVMRQSMLIPYNFGVNPEEKEFLEENLLLIRQMGFSIEPFGIYSYRIVEVPMDLQNIDLKAFFDELLSSVKSLKAVKLADILKDKIAQTACKHAIKGGESLTQEEIDKLFNMLDGNLGLKCPHGRPICVRITKKEIEKAFKRIV